MRCLVAVLLLLSACAAPGEPTAQQPPRPCGFSPSDWCDPPAGDPCGAHRNEASCRMDARCEGMKYRGESLVACNTDGKGFWTNCPAVGCVSKSPGTEQRR
jgi:hypothetical protein